MLPPAIHHFEELRIPLPWPLLPFVGHIMVASLVVMYLICQILLGDLLLPRLHGATWAKMTTPQRRGTTINYFKLGSKVCIFIVMVEPVLSIIRGKSGLESKSVWGGIENRDVLLGAGTVFMAMYLIELPYLLRVPFIYLLHHLSTVGIGMASIGFVVTHHPNAALRFMIAVIWVLLECFFGPVQYIPLIYQRFRPTKHHLLSRMFLCAAAISFLGILTRVITVMYLFIRLWPLWQSSYKVSTLVLQFIFLTTQLWSVCIQLDHYMTHARWARGQFQEGEMDGLAMAPKHARTSDWQQLKRVVSFLVGGRAGKVPVDSLVANLEMAEGSSFQARGHDSKIAPMVGSYAVSNTKEELVTCSQVPARAKMLERSWSDESGATLGNGVESV